MYKDDERRRTNLRARETVRNATHDREEEKVRLGGSRTSGGAWLRQECESVGFSDGTTK